MKNSCIIFLLSIIIILAAFGGMGAGIESEVSQTAGAGSEFLRIHVRANSNEENDQTIKYIIKDEIVEYLTPVVAVCRNKSEAKEAILARIDDISYLASKVLKEQGYGYGGKALLRTEKFPTRVYDEVTLPTGNYEALIVELGEAKGDNWWCVVYPPLCFSGGRLTTKNVVYKSKIAEIITDWKARRLP